MKKIQIRKVLKSDLAIIKEWFAKAYIQEWWGYHFEEYYKLEVDLLENDGINKKLSSLEYWIAEYNGEPFAYMITTDATEGEPKHLMPHISKYGMQTKTLDILIGNEDYLGKNLAAPTITTLIKKLTEADTFLIDPEVANARAVHVYQKAGFKIVAEFYPEQGRYFDKKHVIMQFSKTENKGINTPQTEQYDNS